MQIVTNDQAPESTGGPKIVTTNVAVNVVPVLYWDPDGNASNNAADTGEGLGGDGSCTVANDAVWYNPLTGEDIAWYDGAQAVFNGPDGVVSLSGELCASKISFGSGNYTLQSGSILSRGTQGVVIDVANGGSATVASPITGDGGLTKAGDGTLTLAGDTSNTYTGLTTVEGTLVLAKTNGAIALPGDVFVSETGDGTWTFLELEGDNEIASSSMMTFSTPVAYSVMNMNGHQQTLAGISSDPWATIEGRWDNTGLDVDSQLTINSDADWTYEGTIRNSCVGSGTGKVNLVKTGSGTLTLTGRSTYTGQTRIDAGTISVNELDGAGGIGVGNVDFEGGTLLYTGPGAIWGWTGAITVGAAGGTFDYRPTDMTYGDYIGLLGDISGTGTLHLTGNGGRVAMAGDNSSFTGELDIDAGGFVQLQSANCLGSATVVVADGGALGVGNGASGATFSNDITLNGNGMGSGDFSLGVLRINDYGNSATFSGTITLASDSAINVSTGSMTISGVITGAGGLNKTGDSTLTLAGDESNTYTGLTTVGGTLVLAKTDGAIALPGDVFVSETGDGTWTFLELEGDNEIASSSVMTFSTPVAYSVLDMNGHQQTLAGINSDPWATIEGYWDSTGQYADSQLTITNEVDCTYEGTIGNSWMGNGTGEVSLVKAGSGTLTLANPYNWHSPNSFSGDVTVDGGNLVGTAQNAFGAADNSRTITVDAGGTLTFAAVDMYGNHLSTSVPTIIINGGVVTNSGWGVRVALNDVILNNGTLTSTTDCGDWAAWGINGTVTSYGTSTIGYTAGNGRIMLECGDQSSPNTVFDVESGTLTISNPLVNGRDSSCNDRATDLIKIGDGTLVLHLQRRLQDVAIPVPNGSFESPTFGPGDYVVWDNRVGFHPWHWSTTAPAGIVNNTNVQFGPNPTGVDGNQIGFMNGSGGFWQDGITTFQVGQSYTLTIAITERGDCAGSEGDALRVALFGRQADGGALIAASITLNHSQLANGVVLTEYTVTVPTVQSTDPWAGLPLGIWLNMDPAAGNAGIYFDNVRLTTTVPDAYSGLTQIKGGVLQLGTADALWQSTLDWNNDGGTLDVGEFTSVTLGGLQGFQDFTLTNDQDQALELIVGANGQTTTYSGSLSGPGSLTKIGDGALNLLGTSTYTGATTIDGGVIGISNPANLPTEFSGLLATYYSMDGTAEPVYLIDSTVNFDWGFRGLPAPGIPGSYWCANWQGEVLADVTGDYTFTVTGDDGVRLWVDDQLVCDGWTYQSGVEYSGTIHLDADVNGGWHSIRMDYFQADGPESVKLEWAINDGDGNPLVARQVIPQDHLSYANLMQNGDMVFTSSVTNVPGDQSTGVNNPVVFSLATGNAISITVPNADTTPATVTVSNSGFDSPVLDDGSYVQGGSYDGWNLQPLTYANGSWSNSAIVSNNNSSWYGTFTPAPSGQQVACIEAQGTMWQDVDFAEAGSYTLSVQAAHSPPGYYGGVLPSNPILVQVDGQSVGVIYPTSTDYQEYQTPSFAVTAGTHRISFTGLCPTGDDTETFIDQVAITKAVPNVCVHLATDNGSLTLSRTDGLTFTSGDGIGDASMTFVGSLTDVNAALEGMQFMPTADFGANSAEIAHLQITSSDASPFFLGEPMTDAKSVAVTVSGVNQAPVITVSDPSPTVQVGTVLTFTGDNAIVVSDQNISDALYPTVVNGDFESPDVGTGYFSDGFTGTCPGWTLTPFFWSNYSQQNSARIVGNGAGVGNPDSVDGPDSTQCAMIQGAGTISQDVAFAQAGTYTITFQAAHRDYGGEHTFVVQIDGVVVGTFTPTSTDFQGYNATFTIKTAGVHQVTFLGLNEGGDKSVFLDHVGIAATDALVQVSLSVDHGTLNLGNTNGIVSSSVSDNAIMFSASLQDVNELLAGLVYTPDSDYSGTANLRITTNDLGHSGLWGPKSSTTTVAINALLIDRAPFATVPSTIQGTYGTQPIVFSTAGANAILVGDSDAGNSPVRVTLTAGDGTLTLSQTDGLTFVSFDWRRRRIGRHDNDLHRHDRRHQCGSQRPFIHRKLQQLRDRPDPNRRQRHGHPRRRRPVGCPHAVRQYQGLGRARGQHDHRGNPADGLAKPPGRRRRCRRQLHRRLVERPERQLGHLCPSLQCHRHRPRR